MERAINPRPNRCGRVPEDGSVLQRELRACFEVEKVPLEGLLDLGAEDTREFHRGAEARWPNTSAPELS